MQLVKINQINDFNFKCRERTNLVKIKVFFDVKAVQSIALKESE